MTTDIKLMNNEETEQMRARLTKDIRRKTGEKRNRVIYVTVFFLLALAGFVNTYMALRMAMADLSYASPLIAAIGVTICICHLIPFKAGLLLGENRAGGIGAQRFSAFTLIAIAAAMLVAIILVRLYGESLGYQGIALTLLLTILMAAGCMMEISRGYNHATKNNTEVSING